MESFVIFTFMKTQKPALLKKGDKVAIVTTARKIDKEDIAVAIQLFEDWGLKVVLGTTIGKVDRQFGGTDQERIADFQQQLDDPSVKAIWCARGGYGSVRVIDALDFTQFFKQPKWIIGFSDVTVFHSHLHNLGFNTLHAIMPITVEGNTMEAIKTLRKALFGEVISYEVAFSENNRLGEGTGVLVGGNLSMLYSLLGSPSAITTDGKILFIEDLDEYLYHVDRMMMNLKRNGYFKQLKGLIVGGMTKMNDNTIPFGKTAQEIILDVVSEYDFPVCFDFPAGHIDDNRALIFGDEVKLIVSSDKTALFYN